MQIKLSEYFDGFRNFKGVESVEKIKLINSLNRIVSTDIKSKFNLPLFDNTAMDGYLFDAGFPLSEYVNKEIIVKDSIFAGDDIKSCLKSGECYKIMTGGKVPENIKKPTVIPIEYLQESKKVNNEEIVLFNRHILKEAWGGNNHIRFKGENLRDGEVIISRGDKLSFAKIALLASQGIEEIMVFKELTIGIFSSGSELVSVGGQLSNNANIFDSNSPTIFNTLKKYGFNAKIYPALKDDISIYKENILKALNEVDIVILSGGASVGEKDFTKAFLKEIKAEIFCEKLFMKPGKPTIVAKIDTHKIANIDSNLAIKEKILINLPGNSQACLMNLIVIILPFLYHIQGSNERLQKVQAINKNPIKLANNITSNLLGLYDGRNFFVYNKGIINSSDIVGFSKCNAILSIESDSVAKDSLVDIILYEN